MELGVIGGVSASTALASSAVQAGDLIDHYRLERYLGAGAFATVWLARDDYLDDPVAIKVLADNWARDDDVRGRFIDEAKIMRRIDHQRIVRVFAVDELPSGQPMFVMTYADRGTLADRIGDRRAQARRFDTAEVAAFMIELAACLGIVHDFGVVHRDLKPSNVLFRSPRRHDPATLLHDEVMLLGDFGLAKDTIARSGFTLAAGTPAYMPPEQARTTSELDHRADLYSATAIMFELLAGVAPFQASTLSDVARTRAERRAVLDERRSDIDPAWQELIDVGLATEPSQRFQSAHELAEAVRAVAGHAATSAASLPTFAAPALPGLRGQVDDILRRFGSERSAAIDRRLREPCTVAIVGEHVDLDHCSSAVEAAGLQALRLAAGDVRLGDVDVVVTDGDARHRVVEAISAAAAGPVAVVDAGPAPSATLVHILDVVDRRADVIRASAAVAQLDDDVRRAGSAALSDAWMRVREHVEAIRFDVPALTELTALRAEVAGRVVLPERERAAMRRVLFEVDTASRLGVDERATDAELLDATVNQLAEWRAFQDSGRVPFSSRTAVDTVVRCLERLWATLAGYEGG